MGTSLSAMGMKLGATKLADALGEVAKPIEWLHAKVALHHQIGDLAHKYWSDLLSVKPLWSRGKKIPLWDFYEGPVEIDTSNRDPTDRAPEKHVHNRTGRAR